MIIQKQVKVDDYELDIKITSSTAHAHSMLVDNKETIERAVSRVQAWVMDIIEVHKERYEKHDNS